MKFLKNALQTYSIVATKTKAQAAKFKTIAINYWKTNHLAIINFIVTALIARKNKLPPKK